MFRNKKKHLKNSPQQHPDIINQSGHRKENPVVEQNDILSFGLKLFGRKKKKFYKKKRKKKKVETGPR